MYSPVLDNLGTHCWVEAGVGMVAEVVGKVGRVEGVGREEAKGVAVVAHIEVAGTEDSQSGAAKKHKSLVAVWQTSYHAHADIQTRVLSSQD